MITILIVTLSSPVFANNKTLTAIDSGVQVQRLFGLDRYETAIVIADRLAKQLQIDYSKGQQFQAVILASGNNWPDAISGTALAKLNNAPILLLDSIVNAPGSQDTFDYIKNHVNFNGKVFILGGKGVMPEEFTQYLVGIGFSPSNVQQIGGANRDETSLMIAKTVGSHGLKIVSDENFYDAITASPLEIDWMSGTQTSILLLPRDGIVPDEEKEYIMSRSLVAIGDICSTANLKSLYPYPSLGVISNGGSEYATNSMDIGQSFNTVVIATGEDYPDALTGSVLASSIGSEIILVKNDSIPPESLNNLKKVVPTSEGGKIQNIIVLGGDAAVSENVVNQFVDLVNSSSTDQIVSFKFANNPSIDCKVVPGQSNIEATVPFDTDVTALIPDIKVSDGATIYPNSGVVQDFSFGIPVTYTLTAKDGTKNTYTVQIKKSFPNPQDGILSFELPSLQAVGVFWEPDTIMMYLPHGADVSNLAPKITLLPGETVSPGSGVAQDFSVGPVRYVVTKSNGTKLNYRVMIW